MEEEKKKCCFSNLPAHRVMRIIIKCLIIFIIFSVGALVGSHLNYRGYGRSNFEGRGSRMMGGNRFQGISNCNFQRGIKLNEGDTNQIPGKTQVIQPTGTQASTTPVK